MQKTVPILSFYKLTSNFCEAKISHLRSKYITFRRKISQIPFGIYIAAKSRAFCLRPTHTARLLFLDHNLIKEINRLLKTLVNCHKAILMLD